MNFKIIQFTDSKYYVTKNGQVYSVKNLKYLILHILYNSSKPSTSKNNIKVLNFSIIKIPPKIH